MKIAVTGATGFLGRHIVAELTDGYDVVAISRSGKLPPRLSKAAAAGVTPVSADVTDRASLEAAFAGCNAVIHAAGTVSHDPIHASRMWEVHVEGTRNVAEACASAGVKRLLHLSSSGTIGVSKDPKVHTEDSEAPLATVQEWSYYRAKLLSEQMLLEEAPEDLDVVVLNPSLLLGPDDDIHGESTRSVRMFLDGELPMSPPGGLSFVDVRDVADAVKRALRLGKAGERYLLGGANMSFQSFYSRLARISGKGAPLAPLPRGARTLLSWLPDLGRDGDIGFGIKTDRWSFELACHFWYIDWSKAESDLGWAPRDPLVTLEDTVFDVMDRRARARMRFAPTV